MLSTRLDVEKFCDSVRHTQSALLSELTNGVHLHVIEADYDYQLDAAVQALEEKGYILSD
jgi:transcriptional regulator of NAD metabolism